MVLADTLRRNCWRTAARPSRTVSAANPWYNGMSASKAYVLSTRPLSKALIEEAGDKRIVIDVIPFIGTTWIEDASLRKKLEELASRPLTAIFTSSNAVTAIQDTTRPPWKIFCLSGATGRAVTEKF